MAPFPIMLTFDVDGETLWTGRDRANADRPVLMSQGRYSWNCGIHRVLKLLAEERIPGTFFVPGMTVQANPWLADQILEGGHEIAHHSWSHTWIEKLTYDQEREEFEKGIEIIERFTGTRPQGWRAPALEISKHTVDLMFEYGFRYSSNFLDADKSYFLRSEKYQAPIVEIPVAYPLTDAPYFLYSIAIPGRTIQANSCVLETWTQELTGLHAEQGQMLITMHPEIIGRVSRIDLLRQFIHRANKMNDVAFYRCCDFAEQFRTAAS